MRPFIFLGGFQVVELICGPGTCFRMEYLLYGLLTYPKILSCVHSEQFALLFDSSDDYVLLKKEALSGRLKRYDHVHLVAWQALLGVLPTEKEEGSDEKCIDRWEKDLKASREEYTQLKNELLVNPHQEGDEEAEDATMDNPLSTGESSTWAKYFANSELQKDIFRDVDRTYPEIDFFREEAIQQMMTNILFVYAKKHPEVAYKQGMHEICSIPLYLAHRERVLRETGSAYSVEEGKKDFGALVKSLYDPEFLEHDIYALFSKILSHLSPFYIQSKRSAPIPAASSIDNTLGVTLDGANGNDSNGSSYNGGSAVLRKCKYIQDVLLKKHDEALSIHLNAVELEPQLYLLRWIRILFGREFHLEDTVTVWDSVFAFDDHFGFIDHMAVAMLIFIRSQLLSKEFADCIKRLQKYPPVEDVTTLIEHAIALTKPRPAGIVGPLPFPSSLPPASTGTTPSPTGTPAPGNAPLVSINKPQAAAPTTAATTFRSENRSAAPSKPIVYASPTYNSQPTPVVAAPEPVVKPKAVPASSQPASMSTFSSIFSSQPTPKRTTANASDAQILKATPLNTPPHGGHRHHSSSEETKMVTVPKAQWEELNRQFADTNLRQNKFADQLTTVISSLQQALTSEEEMSPDQVTELLVLSLASLKKTRDIATGLLPDEDELELPPIALSSTPKKQTPSTSSSNNYSSGSSSPASKPTPQPTTSSYESSNTIPKAAPVAGDFGLLPAADTDDWGYSPAAITGNPSASAHNATAASRPASSTSAYRGASPSALNIQATDDASKAAMSAIFD